MKPARVGLVCLLLFCSGACALVFQVAWMREFRLVFGGSTSASAAVLAIFMGGLGLGNALVGRRVDRQQNPLKFYGMLELSIGALVAVSPMLIDLVRFTYISLGGQSMLGYYGAAAVRLALATLVMGLPTIFMGGTLPAAVRAVTTSQDANRRNPALVYACNTLGAVLGSLLSTFVLLEQFGTRGALWLACGVNLLLALAAIRFSRSNVVSAASEANVDARAQRKRKVDHEASALLPSQLPGAISPLVIYLSAAIVGLAFFLMELVWFRMLGPLLGGTTFTFGLILAVALFGIGVGGFLYWLVFSRARRPTIYHFALTCGLEAACLALPFYLGDNVALLANALRPGDESIGFAGLIYGWTIVASIVVLPASIVSGFQFPLMLGLLGEGDRDVGRQVGLTFASNTVGAIAGSLIGGFGILPQLTAPGTWTAVVVLLSLLGLSIVLLAFRKDRSLRPMIAPTAAVVLALLLINSIGPTAAWRHSSIGVGRARVPESRNELQRWLNNSRRRISVQIEGVESSVALSVNDSISFVVNGKSDGSAIHDAGTQIMVGMLGGILHPDPKLGMIIGLGTGESAGWLAECPTIERVDVVELEPAIAVVADVCRAVNCDVLEHPKVRTIFNDGREVLLTSTSKYDVIASEPSNPYRAGVANLYTREFYEGVRNRLSPGGIFVQWLQAYEISPETVGTVCATLRSVFPHAEIWQTQATDTVLVCSLEPLKYDVAALRRRITQEPYKSALWNAWRVVDLEGFLAHYLAGSKVVQQYGDRQSTINTDDCNRIEYDFARSLGKKRAFSIQEIRQKALAIGDRRPFLTDSEIDWDAADDQQLLVYLTFEHEVLDYPDHTPARRARGRAYRAYLTGKYAEAIREWEQHRLVFRSPQEVTMLAFCYANVKQKTAAERLLKQVSERQPFEAEVIRATLHWQENQFEQTASSLETAFTTLHTQPWVTRHIVNAAIVLADALPRKEPSLAPRMHRALEREFPVLILDERRLLARLSIGTLFSAEEVVRDLEPWEPHPPWSRELLAVRATAYETMQHPLAERAQRDLDQFDRNQRDEKQKQTSGR